MYIVTPPRGNLFHAFRHTAATWMLSRNVNQRTIQEILGHKSSKTTEVYAHVLDEQKRNALAGQRAQYAPTVTKEEEAC